MQPMEGAEEGILLNPFRHNMPVGLSTACLPACLPGLGARSVICGSCRLWNACKRVAVVQP